MCTWKYSQRFNPYLYRASQTEEETLRRQKYLRDPENFPHATMNETVPDTVTGL